MTNQQKKVSIPRREKTGPSGKVFYLLTDRLMKPKKQTKKYP
jgi:hypothetical protein